MTHIYAHLDTLGEVIDCLAWDMLLDKEKTWYEAQWSNWKVNIMPETVGLEFEDKSLIFFCIDDTKKFGAFFTMSYLKFYEFYKKVDGEFYEVNKAIAKEIGQRLINHMELITEEEVVDVFGDVIGD